MAPEFDLLVHVSHEAGCKIGGIGAVLAGLLTAPSYNAGVRRSILIGALEPGTSDQVFAPRNQLTLRYAPGDGIVDVPPYLAAAFGDIEQHFSVTILYGVRAFGDTSHEVLLVEVSNARAEVVSDFKYALHESCGLDSSKYESDAEFERYIRLCEPAYAALHHLAANAGPNRVILAHEWMGVPLALTARMKDPGTWRTAFYAHEVASARLLVEQHDGHDLRFYNALRVARTQGRTMAEVFGDQSYYFKQVLIQKAADLDVIMAVGDPVVDELRFVGGGYAFRPVDLVYNGVPASTVTLADKTASRERLVAYASNLLGMTPDLVFSHVTRFVLSKALWRDLRVLTHLDAMLAQEGRTAVHFVLSTALPTGRPSHDVHRWEAEYGWPVGHRADNGDLMGLEADFYFAGVQAFNASAQAIRVVLVNQFGWDRARCGSRMPADMGFMDLRMGSDLELGLSIYEPFGIAQVEPLSAGAICAVSDICGCVGFVRHASQQLLDLPNLVVGRYTQAPAGWTFATPWDALTIDRFGRDLVEDARSLDVARAVHQRLPTSDRDRTALIESGTDTAGKMSWDTVVSEYLLPALRR